MGLHQTPAEHEADPPAGWTVVKVAERAWHLRTATDGHLQTYSTRREAERAKTSGFWVDLYEKEGRWFAGLPVTHWRPYVPV
jgi:hypothetical protein